MYVVDDISSVCAAVDAATNAATTLHPVNNELIEPILSNKSRGILPEPTDRPNATSNL